MRNCAQIQTVADGDESLYAVAAARARRRETLVGGPRPASPLRQEAATHGGEKALYAARKAESVTVSKERVLDVAAGSGRLPRMLGKMAKMALRPIPEMFAIFAKFANFNRALKKPAQIHRQEPRF